MTHSDRNDCRLLLQIKLENLLSFGHGNAPLKLENLNVLIGPNAAGKSNLIEALSLLRAARALAASLDREYVVPDDIKSLVGPVLEHRLGLAPDAQLAGGRPSDVLSEVLAAVPVPAGRTGS